MAGKVLDRRRGAGRPPGPLAGLTSVLHSTVGMLEQTSETQKISKDLLNTFFNELYYNCDPLSINKFLSAQFAFVLPRK